MNVRIKKTLSFLLIILCSLSLFGCSGDKPNEEFSTIENGCVFINENESQSETKANQTGSTTAPATTSSATTAPATSDKTAKAPDTTRTETKKTDINRQTTRSNAVTTKKAQTSTNKPDVRNVCTISIDCETVLNNKDKLSDTALKIIPSSGTILQTTEYYIDNENTTVFDVLKKVCRDNNIHLEFSYTPAYHSTYIEGIANLYERDCGSLSGWMYSVNGEYPNVGCSEVTVKNGDVIKWRYTCDLGWDVGAGDFG